MEMYEPYEERKKTIKIDLEKVKEKVKNLVKDVEFKRWSLVILALAVLGLGSGITGYMSYTSKINDYESRIGVLEMQVSGCQENLESAQSDLSVFQSQSQECESDLETTESELTECTSDKLSLEGKVETVGIDLTKCKDNLKKTKTDLEKLKDDYGDLECNYAEKVCSAIEFEYYTVKNDEVFCCSPKGDGKYYCGGELPSINENEVKDIKNC